MYYGWSKEFLEAGKQRLVGDTARAADEVKDLREALDIDSLDFLNFVTALHKKMGVNVPEADYPKLITLNKTVGYTRRLCPPRAVPKRTPGNQPIKSLLSLLPTQYTRQDHLSADH